MQAEGKLIQMQSGCICCTLREDLLREISSLVSQGAFDYIVIESTGISEPQQVCGTTQPNDVLVHGRFSWYEYGCAKLRALGS